MSTMLHNPLRRQRRRYPPKQSSMWPLLLSLGLGVCAVNVVYLMYATSAFQQFYTQIEFLPNYASNNYDFVYDMNNNNNDHDNNNDQNNQNNLGAGKERLLEILAEAGIHNVTDDVIRRLPTWEQVTSMYGDQPRIHGLDTCDTFQTTILPEEAVLGVAGIFNSGTNLLAELLIHNCHLPKRQRKYGGAGIRWQVNWGKHQPPRYRLDNHVDVKIKDNDNTLPAVTIRDPYAWMQSMCRHRYSAHWFHAQGHCPNLIPNSVDREFLEYAKTGAYKYMFDFHQNDPWLKDNVMNTADFTTDSSLVPLYVRYNQGNVSHDSLAHMWNDWYDEYIQADFPRVLVRFEDLIFFAKEVTTKVCHCAGGEMYPRKFEYIVESAKMGVIHGDDKTNLVDALIRYGTKDPTSRITGMTPQDIEFAKRTFDPTLMEIFGYHHPDE